jgi:hypothetical protein
MDEHFCSRMRVDVFLKSPAAWVTGHGSSLELPRLRWLLIRVINPPAMGRQRTTMGQLELLKTDAFAQPITLSTFSAELTGMWVTHVPVERRIGHPSSLHVALPPATVTPASALSGSPFRTRRGGWPRCRSSPRKLRGFHAKRGFRRIPMSSAPTIRRTDSRGERAIPGNRVREIAVQCWTNVRKSRDRRIEM